MGLPMSNSMDLMRLGKVMGALGQPDFTVNTLRPRDRKAYMTEFDVFDFGFS
jgi:hypothetical protein